MTETRCFSERLAVGIGAFQSTEIRAITQTYTGGKKAHRGSLRESHGCAEKQYRACQHNCTIRVHAFLPPLSASWGLLHKSNRPCNTFAKQEMRENHGI